MGGAIGSGSADIEIENCIMEANHANKGGGLRLIGSDSVRIMNCQFLNNEAEISGGGISMANPILHVPAEEERHQNTFMQWPVSQRVYSDRYFLRQVQETIADIANTIAEFEPVTMLAAKKLVTCHMKSVL